MPRLFVAINVPPDQQLVLNELQTGLDGVRWTNPQQLHLTLRFLGDVKEEHVESVETSLKQLTDHAPVSLRAEGLTGFPSRRSPRVLVVALERDPALMALQKDIEEAMQELGFPPENRPFSPHITYGRVKYASPREVHSYLKERSDIALRFEAPAFTLTESTLSAEGARHTPRAAIPLQGPSP